MTALARQPNMIALVLGLAVNLSGLRLPGFLAATLDTISHAALPVSLFALGGVMSRLRLRGSIGASLFVAVISLVVRPAIVLALGLLAFDLSQASLRSAVLTAAMAPGVNSFLFANLYERGRDVAANSVLLGTGALVLTAPAWITLLLLIGH
jgi:predicted permease